ncbi:MAG: N-acetylmuramoyl-L-alanine amidase [Deltaproteobacteria bacterium]|nr:N-acetylmuramoyl-L-alanine amidase [Deltaproteobacteria bacterium]
MVRASKYILASLLLILAIGRPVSVLAASEVLNIRHWVAPDHTRVVIDVSDDAPYTVDKEDRKLAINLENTSAPDRIRQKNAVNKPGLEATAVLPRGEKGVRVELALPGQVQTTVFKLKPFQDQPYRIVIDIVLPEVARQEREAREKVKVTRKDRVVVIDPGHGGEAVGAVGKGGTLEKDVVLAIGRKLRNLLNKRPGYRAFLTRDGDYYVSFKNRLQIAREYGADLFISIHADAAQNRTASGSSVYCLSTGGASSAAAKILARNENLADIVGGVANGESADASDPIILNMFQTHAINQSKDFGVHVLENVKGVSRLKYPTVQEAPFAVLKIPEIPSVLIETAYISNPQEEKLLKSDRFQTRIAESLARSIGECLPPYPPLTVIAASGKERQRTERRPAEVEKTKTAGGEAERLKGEEAVPEDQVAAVLSLNQQTPGALNGTPRNAAGGVQEAKSEETVREAPVAEVPRPLPKPSASLKTAQGRAGAGDKALKREEANREVPAPTLSRPKPEPPGAEKGGALPAARPKSVLYRVKKGDTLDTIARKHGTSVALLVKLNGIDPRASLYVDRLLKINGTPPGPRMPVAGKGERGTGEQKAAVPGKGKRLPATREAASQPKPKPEKRVYRVKKGDNLEVIARKHGTTVQVLRELNRLNLSAPLYVDRKLLLPGHSSL